MKGQVIRVVEPLPGFSKNPLNHKMYRNLVCWCGSKKKVKKCHGMHYAIPTYQVNIILQFMRGVRSAEETAEALTKAEESQENKTHE